MKILILVEIINYNNLWISMNNLNASLEDKFDEIRLDSLKVGESAIIKCVEIPFYQNSTTTEPNDLTNQNTISRRLKELGFINGEIVKMLHKGYFSGEPFAVRIGQSTFALRRFEAQMIIVKSITSN